MARAESAHDLIGKSVFILTVQLRRGNTWSKIDPLPFASPDTLKRHLCDLISHYLVYLDEKWRRPLIAHLEAKNYTKCIRLFRRAQLENSKPVPLNFSWKEQATVIM